MLYVNPDPSKQTRGNWLGCGWVDRVPASHASVAVPPCVIVSGAGQTIVVADNGSLTPSQVATAAAPVLAAEAAAEAAYVPPTIPVGPAGPQGPAGPAGPGGAQGPSGTQGVKGDPGTPGTAGTPGTVGSQGIKGDTGLTGTQGNQGIQGVQGPQGPAGSAGTAVVLTATQTNSTITPAVLTGCTFTIPAGGTLSLQAILIATAAAVTTGVALGVRVTQPAGASAAAIGACKSYVGLAAAASATGLEFGNNFNVAAGSNALVEILGTASTAGNQAAMANAIIKNQAAAHVTTVTVEFRSEVAASAVTAQIGTSAAAVLI